MLQSEWLNGDNPRQVNDMNNQEQRQMMNEDIFSITNASHSIVHTGKIR